MILVALVGSDAEAAGRGGRRPAGSGRWGAAGHCGAPAAAHAGGRARRRGPRPRAEGAANDILAVPRRMRVFLQNRHLRDVFHTLARNL